MAFSQVATIAITVLAVGGLLWASFRPGGKAWYTLAAAAIMLLSRHWLLSGDNPAPFVGVVTSTLGAVSIALIFFGILMLLFKQKWLVRLAGVAAVICMAFAPVWVSASPSDLPAVEPAEDEEAREPTEEEVDAVQESTGLSEEDGAVVGRQIIALAPGYAAGELVVEDDLVDKDYDEERGIAAFSERTLETRQQVCEYLQEDTPKSKLARERVEEALKDHPGEFARIAEGDCSRYLLICAKVASQILGTSYVVDGKVKVSDEWRAVGPDDCIWIYITEDLVVVAQASIRADCANPGLTKMVPVRPSTPPAPPIEVPPDTPICPDDGVTPVPPSGICPKTGMQVNDNPNVPPGGQGPGTDNPGAPIPVVDLTNPDPCVRLTGYQCGEGSSGSGDNGGTPGSGTPDPDDPDQTPLPPGGDDGTSDPEPEPDPPDVTIPAVPDFCDTVPDDHPACLD